MGVISMLVSFSVKRLGQTFDRDWDKWPEATRLFVANYGARQFVNDGHAPVKREDYENDEQFQAAIGAKVADRIEMLDTGNVPGSRAPADPKAAAIRAATRAATEAGMTTEEVVALIQREAAKKSKKAA
jgi:hypothetical protein